MSATNKASPIANTAASVKSVGDAARQVTDKAAGAGADALQQARGVASDAQDRAISLLGAAGEKANSVAEAQKQNVAGYLEDMAKAVHRSGEQLEGHQDFVAKMVERGADELASLAGTLRSNDLQSLMGSLGSLARRQPALFVGASMAAGFALARIGRIAAATTPTSNEIPSDRVAPSVPETTYERQ